MKPKMITMYWMEYTHKIKGCGGIEIYDEFSHRAFIQVAEAMIGDGLSNYLGMYQQVNLGEDCEMEVDTEALKQILHYYIDSL